MARILRSALGLALVGFSLATQPNIVIIFPDDQDLHLDSTSYQPILQREFINKGTSFTVSQYTMMIRLRLIGISGHTMILTAVIVTR